MINIMPRLKYQFLASEEDRKHLLNPVPASKAVPDWYKNMPRARNINTLEPMKSAFEVDTINGGLRGGITLKECIPVRDYLTSGYIIPMWLDLAVNVSEGTPHFAWGYKDTLKVGNHPDYQVYKSPLENKKCPTSGIPKLFSPWGFKTPKGYSSFFFSPKYSQSKLEVLPAIVDTDTHHEINFPFLYHGEEGCRDLIKRGEPIIQVIPFKRESWNHSVSTGEFMADKTFRTFLIGAYLKLKHQKKSFM